MRLAVGTTFILAMAVLALVGNAQTRQHLNPMIDLLEQKKPLFGVYWPGNPQGRRGGPPPADAVRKPPAEWAKEALAYRSADFLFNGSMEGGVDRAIGGVTDFVKATADAGALTRTPFPRFAHPLVVKAPKIAPDLARGAADIGRELNLGVSGIMFVETESAAEVQAGINAMRFKSKGGTRPDDVGQAPKFWGLSEKEYREKADLWPLNPNGELLLGLKLEDKYALENAEANAKVPGVAFAEWGPGDMAFSLGVKNGPGPLPPLMQAARAKVFAATKAQKIFFLNSMNADNVVDMIKEGVMIGPASEKAAEIGRKYSKRTMPW